MILTIDYDKEKIKKMYEELKEKDSETILKEVKKEVIELLKDFKLKI